MAGMGLDTAYGAGGSSDALATLFQQRMQQAAGQRAQQSIDQTDALTRLKLQEHADTIRQELEGKRQAEKDRADAATAAAQDRHDKLAMMQFGLTPVGGDVAPADANAQIAAGIPSGLLPKTPGAQVQQTSGFMPLPSAPPTGPGMQPISGLSPINGSGTPPPPPSGPQIAPGASTTSTDAASPLNAPATFTRGATQADVEKGKADALAASNATNRSAEAEWKLGIAQQLADLHGAAGPKEHYSQMPQFGPDGQPMAPLAFNEGTGTARAIPGVGANRAAPGAAQTAKTASDKKAAIDTLGQLDQAIENAKDLIGPGEGRISNVEQMIGNADPKIQALGTKMLLAKMKVDASIGGARAAASPQLLKRWDNLLANKVTPEGLKAVVQAMREIVGGADGAGGSAAGNVEQWTRDANGQLVKK